MDGRNRPDDDFGKLEKLISVMRELAKANAELRSHPNATDLAATRLIALNEYVLRRNADFLTRIGIPVVGIDDAASADPARRSASVEDLSARSADLHEKSNTSMRESGVMSAHLADLNAGSDRLIGHSKELLAGTGKK